MGVGSRHPRQGSHGGEADGRLGAGQGPLQAVDGGAELLRLEVGDAADGPGGLVDDHVGAVAQAGLQELVPPPHDWRPLLDGLARGAPALGDLVVQELGGVPDEADYGQGAAQGVLLAELLHQLRYS